MQKKTEISVIGLGDMGAVLARTLLQKGYSVTVWNRSAAKAAPLVKDGAQVAPDAAAAIAASPITIICVANYSISGQILSEGAVQAALPGKLIIELSTGTPQEARNEQALVQQYGATYLDGAILATPPQIGREDTPIFISGPVAEFGKSEAIMKTLAGGLQYMGEAIGAAATWDLGFLSYLFGGMMGFFHGARVFQSEGIPVEALGQMILQVSPNIGEMVKHSAGVIQQQQWQTPISSVKTCYNTVKLFMQHAQEAGITDELPRYMDPVFQKAIAAGYGDEELGAVIKVLR